MRPTNSQVNLPVPFSHQSSPFNFLPPTPHPQSIGHVLRTQSTLSAVPETARVAENSRRRLGNRRRILCDSTPLQPEWISTPETLHRRRDNSYFTPFCEQSLIARLFTC